MIKILQINVEVNYSSTGRIAEGIGEEALKVNWESYIAYGRKVANSISKVIKIGNSVDNFVHVLDTRLTGRHGQSSKSATKSLIKKIDQIQPDLIQLHNLHGYYLNIEVLFKYLSTLKIPIIYSLHDLWPLTGHCPQFEHINCEKWKSTCFQCPQTKEYPKSLVFDRSTKNHLLKKKIFSSIPDVQLVTSSNWSSDKIKQSYLSKYPIEVIPNGIDQSVFYPRKKEDLLNKLNIRNKFVILGVANVWTSLKGLDDFMEFGRRLESDETIVLIGLTKKQIQKLPNGIIGIERTKNVDELAQFYSVANVFVNLTYADTFPTTNLEALACGTPLITYNTGGSVESVTDKTGFIVNQGNLKELRICVNKVKENSDDYYFNDCVRVATQKYNRTKQFKKYIELYSKLIEEKDNYCSKVKQ